jgi:hypothetical protein
MGVKDKAPAAAQRNSVGPPGWAQPPGNDVHPTKTTIPLRPADANDRD